MQACGGIRKFSVLNEQPAMLLYWEERPRPTWGGFLWYVDSKIVTRLRPSELEIRGSAYLDTQASI